MSKSLDPAELELVRRAILLGRTLGGCCEWHRSAIERLNHRPPYQSFTLAQLRDALCDFIAQEPEAVIQVKEQRPEYCDRRFYYKVILPIAELARGLFVELVIEDDDPEYPVVLIVNAHEQSQ
jgi:hypothetical protein